MKIKLRLYRAHDIDLIVLAKTGTVNIPDEARNAIISYFRGDNTHPKIEIKDLPEGLTVENIMQRTEADRKQKCMVFTVSISDRDAPGIEKWILGLRKGYRNCLIKSMLRIYLTIIPEKILASLFSEHEGNTDNAIEETPEVSYNYSDVNVKPQEKDYSENEVQTGESQEAVPDDDLDPTSILLNM